MTSAISITECAERQPWIIMVHGMSQDHRVFERQIEAFRDAYNLLLVDLPGHGLAASVGGPYGHNEFARHVGDAIAQHGISSAHYWGTHTGATVGLLVAAAQPRIIRSLILEGP
ncbi:MAG: alpha/beta fold hydrolase, partial [Alphaproteobacteria bacterium]|nr:alpha/beta fold hydrolase [Alphaproteobacteria bacterium]